MKRMIALILLFFTLLTFAACGQNEPEHTTEASSIYKYDMLSDRFVNTYTLITFPFRAFKGGCLVMTTPEIFSGRDVPLEKSGRDWNMYLFDEETKVLYLPCFNASCSHSSNEECFSKKLFYCWGNSYWNAVGDRIFIAGYGSEGEYMLHGYYYSLDGTLEDRFVFDLSQLKNADGSDAVDPRGTMFYGAYGNKVYYDVAGYDLGYQLPAEGGEVRQYNKWLVEFDLTTNEFRLIANYLVPDNYSYDSEFYLIDGSRLTLCYDNRIFYTFDLSTGEYEVETEEIPDSSQYARAFAQFTCGGDYYTLSSRKEGKLNYRIVTEREETLIVSETFGNGAYVLGDLFAESENGLIYNYYENGKTADDDIYTVNENGRDVVYVKPKRLVYVEKADLADGTVDEPLFYDAELGMFSAVY